MFTTLLSHLHLHAIALYTLFAGRYCFPFYCCCQSHQSKYRRPSTSHIVDHLGQRIMLFRTKE